MTSTTQRVTTVQAGRWPTHLIEEGTGAPVVLLHGSGPGVTAHANWRLSIPALARSFRVLAPDLVGFGGSALPPGLTCDVGVWADQVVGLLDALGLDRASLVGNSFGGAIALHTAVRHPERVDRLVLMGSAGVPFPLTPGLDAVWGYTPSSAAMREVLELFAHDRARITDDLVELRLRASLQPGLQESYARLFAAPRQRWVDALACSEAQLRALQHPTLVVHGRQDRVIPLATSLRLAEVIDGAELHVFGRCGHWTQIERAEPFTRLLGEFLAREVPAG